MSGAGQLTDRSPLVLARALPALGRDVTDAMATATDALFAPLHAPISDDVALTRDLAYGDDERQRLDVFAPAGADGSLPVLMFVHGGGFVSGDRAMPGLPFYDNVGLWAVAHDFVGVNISYRLAPEHRWPAAIEDVADALRWLRANAGRFGANPDEVLLVGHSAGASAAVACVALRERWPDAVEPVVAAVLLSGHYDPIGQRSGSLVAYVGIDDDEAAAAGDDHELALPARYAAAGLPTLLAYAELDPPQFGDQALDLLARLRATGARALLTVAAGHNHISLIDHLNGGDWVLGAQIMRFLGLSLGDRRAAAQPDAPAARVRVPGAG